MKLEADDSGVRLLLRVSRRLLVKFVYLLLRSSFSLPNDRSSLLIAQALPDLTRGLVLLKVCTALFTLVIIFSFLIALFFKGDLSWESQGVTAHAVCLCYWTQVPDVKMAIVARAQKKVILEGKPALSEIQKIVHIASLDDTVASFRLGMNALFSGKTPYALLAADNDGMLFPLEDSLPLKHYQLSCFQVILARFSSSAASTDTCAASISGDVAAANKLSSVTQNDNQRDVPSVPDVSASAHGSPPRTFHERKCVGVFHIFTVSTQSTLIQKKNPCPS